MEVESRSRDSRALPRTVADRSGSATSSAPSRSIVATLGMTAGLSAAHAATGDSVAPGAVEAMDLFQVFGRLDATATGLIVAAAVIVALLVWRVAAMVNRERRPASRSASTRDRVRASGDDSGFAHSTLRASTDWGHDQNKRSSEARQTVEVTTTSVELPSLADAVTQWTMSDVQNAAQRSRDGSDALGRPTHQPSSPYRTAFNPYFSGESPGSDIEVVEVADTLLQAELLVQLGDPKHAMTLLSNHIRTHERPGPAIWLMLLDLYQATGRKSQYEALSKGFSTLFNAMVPAWSASPENVARDLETYPQVLARLQSAWSKPGGRPYIEGLLNDDRGGSRQGFSLTAYRELLFLQEIVNQLDQIAAEDDEREHIQRKLGRMA